MPSDLYIRPGEFIALLACWFAPPCLLAAWCQLRFFKRHPRIGRGPLLATWVGTPIGSVLLGLALLVASPPWLRFLGVKDLPILGLSLPVFPLAYVSVAFVGGLATGLCSWIWRDRPSSSRANSAALPKAP